MRGQRQLAAPMVEVVALKKSFPVRVPLWRALFSARLRTTVLDGVSLSVGRGRVLSVLGANGAGKTTLLQLIAGVIVPDEGTVRVGGTIGLCSSAERSFYFRLTLRENLRFFGTLVGLRGNRLEQRIDELLEITDLTRYSARLIVECSSGMRQRATIARALLRDPDVVLLDEPTRMLDPIHAAELHAFIQDRLVARGKTVLVATNLLDEAWKLSDEVALLNAGRLVAIDTPERLRARASPSVRYRIACDPIDEHLIERITRDGDCIVSREEDSLLVDLSPDASRFTCLLKALTQNGLQISAISREEPPAPALFRLREGPNA